jgi:hypothetical protein
VNHRLPRRGRRALGLFTGVAIILSVLVLSPITANADAGNPILGTIRAVATDNGNGTVTVFVRGQWNWLSHSSDCNTDRAATGLGVAWNDLNGPGTTKGNNEVQRVALTGTVTGGTFKLKFGGQQTGDIAFNATAAQVDAALEALSSIGAGNVSVTGGPGPNSPWSVEFTGDLGLTDVPAMTATKNLTGTGTGVSITTLTGGSAPVFNGFLVENGNISAYIGYKDATAVGGPTDRMVHPVDRGNQVEGYTVAGTDYPATQQFVDPSPADPNSFLTWKGGCGRLPLTATASKGSNPERTGLTCANGTTNCSGHPWGSWGYEKNGGFGYSHTYLKELPNNGGSGLPDKVCVNFYDVHGGGDVGDVKFQQPNNAGEITVDSNGDNSIDTNAFNVNDGANCVTVTGSELVTVATDTRLGGSIHDTASLSGVPAGAGGTITFKAFKRTGNSPDCSGTADFTSAAIPVNGPGDYGSGNFTPGSTGTYDWLVTYSGDPGNLILGTTAPCGDQTGGNDETSLVINPSIEVLKDPDSQSTVSGNTVTFTIKVTNTGDSTLTNVHVTDAQAPDCARTAAQIAADRGSSTFAPGATYTYTCTSLAINAPLDNVATACGDPPFGPEVCDDDHGKVGLEHLKSYQDFVPNDFADMSVEGSSVPLNGHLTMALYKGSCTGANLLFTQTVNVNGDGSYETTNTESLSDLIGSINTDGTYNWQLTYSGDTNGNAPINGACGTERFTLTNGADAP